MKLYTIIDLLAILAGFTGLYCLFSNAVLFAGLFIWVSLMLGGISMNIEAKTIAENRVETIKSLHDWN